MQIGGKRSVEVVIVCLGNRLTFRIGGSNERARRSPAGCVQGQQCRADSIDCQFTGGIAVDAIFGLRISMDDRRIDN
jgi:hypothetical protein